MLDLDALNKTGALAGGSMPLRTWLANAAHLASQRVESALFARVRDRLPTAVAGAPAAPQVSIGRLPVTSRDLFGREPELAWLDQCWVEGVYVATIIAWGGVEKSALVNA
jgi:hypothetical protein